MSAGLPQVGAAELSVRLQPLASASAYVTLLAPGQAIPELVSEIVTELRGLDSSVPIHPVTPCDGAARLLHELPAFSPPGALVVDAGQFRDADWRLLDRQRSDLKRDGVTVFVTTQSSFETLMRVAPHLASFLGGHLFAWDSSAGTTSQEEVARRLSALRAWAAMSDEQVIASAKDGTLARDPEYAEWLVLLGRGDLLA